MHNLGVVYARLFLFPEADRMFSMAYQKSHTESSRLCYLYAMNYITEDDSADTRVPELQFRYFGSPSMVKKAWEITL